MNERALYLSRIHFPVGRSLRKWLDASTVKRTVAYGLAVPVSP